MARFSGRGGLPGTLGQREQTVPQLLIGQLGRVVGQGDDLGQCPAQPANLLDCRTELLEIGGTWVGHGDRPARPAGALPCLDCGVDCTPLMISQ